MVHYVSDLSAEQKLTVEGLLGRVISGDEAVSIKAIPRETAKPSTMSPEERGIALAKFERYFAQIDAGRGNVTPEEEDAIITAAIRSVRPGYRPVE